MIVQQRVCAAQQAWWVEQALLLMLQRFCTRVEGCRRANVLTMRSEDDAPFYSFLWLYGVCGCTASFSAGTFIHSFGCVESVVAQLPFLRARVCRYKACNMTLFPLYVVDPVTPPPAVFPFKAIYGLDMKLRGVECRLWMHGKDNIKASVAGALKRVRNSKDT